MHARMRKKNFQGKWYISVSRVKKYATFDSLKPEAKMEPLQKFVSYIEENWICSTVWPPKVLERIYAINQNKQ
ncbi:hypothetical protein pdam_00025910 [Pocillopora damicornis]|uniref:Uncharacterized protein n=1 Tax=Pocillopora damicornis TaxID=46731 RepID=A0A3M6UJY1_POCDA|nr:hypothetical protein pdam_00025910 [Pocillopora damicornis]